MSPAKNDAHYGARCDQAMAIASVLIRANQHLTADDIALGVETASVLAKFRMQRDAGVRAVDDEVWSMVVRMFRGKRIARPVAANRNDVLDLADAAVSR